LPFDLDLDVAEKKKPMEAFWTIAVWNLAATAALMVAGWGASVAVRNVTLVDTLWGAGFFMIAWLTFFTADGYTGRALLLALLTSIWGVRLSLHLALRNRGKGEDPRYAAWRRTSGSRFWLTSLFKVFLTQAVFLWIIALALQYGQAAAGPARLTLFDLLGTAMWMTGFVFEALADLQLARFKSVPENSGRVMRSGLWALSRHPNYFGETLVWWGIFFIVSATPGSWWTIASPLVITAVLLKMTGIPLTETHTAKSRPGYREYIACTSAFIPWFPRCSKEQSDANSHSSGRSRTSA
jgi:steroid 5-alpha reductase family enzyme